MINDHRMSDIGFHNRHSIWGNHLAILQL